MDSFTTLVHALAERFQVVDVDDILDLPMPKIRAWVKYFDDQSSRELREPRASMAKTRAKRRITDPAEMEKMIAARYG